MILPEDTPPSPTKSQQAAAESAANANADSASPSTRGQVSSESNPPPAYPGYVSYQRSHPVPTPPLPPPIPTRSYSPPRFVRYAEPAGPRFMKAFCVALLIWIAIGTLTEGIVVVSSGRKHSKWNDRQRPDRDWEVLPEVPSDGQVTRCIKSRSDWSADKGMPMASFELPLASKAIYLFSKGVHSDGDITIQEDFDMGNNGTVKVDVSTFWWNGDVPTGLSVCEFERRPGEHGIGFFTTSDTPRSFPLPGFSLFRVVVRIPTQGETTPVRVPAFETDLPNFTHRINAPGHSIVFDSISLKSVNSGITSDYLFAEDATLETSNGPINGDIKSSKSLTLITSNAPIDVSVELLHNNKRSPTSLYMQSSNGGVTARTTLTSTDPSFSFGKYRVTAKTTNSPTTLTFPTAPISSLLTLVSETSNSPTYITLDRTYEGEFDLATSKFQDVAVHLSNDDGGDERKREDPTGKGRKRSLWFGEQDRGRAVGEVYWGEKRPGDEGERETWGNVRVRTTNAPVVLNLA